jgi:hypothetical protein
LTDPVRVGGRVVEDGVPLLSLERAELAVAIPDEPLDLGRQHAVVASTAREDGHLVAARDRVLNEVGSDEPGAAEDEDAHGRARGCGRSGGQEAGRAGADEHRTADGGGGLQEIASAGHLLGKGWVG